MSPFVISLGVFVFASLTVLLLLWGLNDLFGQSRRQISQRVQQLTQEERGSPQAGSRLFDKEFTSEENRYLFSQWQQQWELMLVQAGIKASLPQCVVFLVIVGGVCGGLVYVLTEAVSLAVMAGVGSVLAGVLSIHQRRKARMELLVQQMPEAFDLMARTVRAGQTVLSAMRLAADNLEAPLADHFRVCCEQQSLGIPFDRSVEDFAASVNVLECRMFCVALLLQRQAGGNPAEVMEKLARVIRRRLAMQGKVKALTSEGRMQAVALTLLPVAAFILIYMIDPEYCRRLLDVPWLFWGTVGSMLLGGWWIQRIITIEY